MVGRELVKTEGNKVGKTVGEAVELSVGDSVVLEVGESVGSGIILLVMNLVIQLEKC